MPVVIYIEKFCHRAQTRTQLLKFFLCFANQYYKSAICLSILRTTSMDIFVPSVSPEGSKLSQPVITSFPPPVLKCPQTQIVQSENSICTT